MQELVALLKSKKLTIASVESLTAGLFCARMAEVSGASAVLKGGLVTYMTSCKADVLHVPKILIATYGVISEEIAIAMAEKGSEMFQCDIVCSFTGNAGPTVMDDKPVGLVHMAIYYQGQIHAFHQRFHGDRNTIRNLACDEMVRELKKIIK